MAETFCEREKEKKKISCIVDGGRICEEHINARGFLSTIVLFNFVLSEELQIFYWIYSDRSKQICSEDNVSDFHSGDEVPDSNWE
jgi:hypothetical protein